MLSGIPGQFDHPKVQKALERIAQAARKTGKHWGAPTSSPEHAKKLLDMGATLLCYNADLIMVKTGLEQIQEKFSPLGFRFQNQFTEAAKSYLSNR